MSTSGTFQPNSGRPPGTTEFSVLFISTEQSLCTRARKQFEQLEIRFARFDWISDPRTAQEQLNQFEYQLVFIDASSQDTVHNLLGPPGTPDRPAPPLVLVSAEGEPLDLTSAPQRVIDSISLDSLSSASVSRMLRVAADHSNWNRVLEHHRSFEALIASISTRFIQLASAEMDNAIQEALGRCGTFCDVDRAYMMLISEDRKTISMTHEWVRDGVERAAHHYAAQPIEPLRWLHLKLSSGDAITCGDVLELPESARGLRDLARTRGVKSFVLVPLFHGGSLLGLLGFSQIRQSKGWSDDTVSLLRILGEILINAVLRKRSEEAFKDSEIRFRTLVESLGEGIMLCDASDTILHVNSRTADLTGYSPDEMIGRRTYELLLPSDEAYKIRERTLRRLQGVAESFTVRLQRKDGSRFWAEINAAPIRGRDGAVAGTVAAVTDISDRKLALEALQASERKYRDLVETSSDLIWSCDLEGRWTFVNRASERIYGLQPSELLGRKFTEILAPECIEHDLAAFQRLKDGAPLFQYETSHLRRDGSRVQMSFNAIALRDKDGRVLGTTGTATDITARKETEAALSKSEERFKRYFDLPLIGMGVSNSERRWIEVNEKFCEMLGYSKQELLGRSWMDFTHPEDVEKNLDMVKRAVSGEHDQWSYDKRFIRRDGSILYVTTSSACIRKPDGSVECFLALHQDISSRKAAEAEMILQKQFLREVIDSSPNAVFAKDLEGRYTLANRAMAELYNRSVDEIVGKTDLELTNDTQLADAFKAADRAVIDSNEPHFYPEGLQLDRKTGQYRKFQTIKKPLRAPNGGIGGVLGVAWDITELKAAEDTAMRLQKQLLQSQKMEAIGQLAAGIAHDLNNALAAVVGHLQLLRLGAGEGRDEQSIDIALSGCKRASSLIEQLLGFSRQGKYNIATISLQRLVRETTDFLRKVVGTNIRMEIDDSGPDVLVKGDTAQIQQALTNLIINAKQAIDGGGVITFRFGARTVEHPERFNTAAHAGRFAFVSVEDTGIGIPPENIDKVFEPFFTTKGQSNGTGLGLSTVYGVMQSHGGWVEVDSALGSGTTFSLYFPEARGAVLEVVHSKSKEPLKCSGTVVVIDDEKVLVDLGQEFLKRAGFKTFGFTDAATALDWYRSHYSEVDLLVLDMKMPGMDGLTCFDELLKVNPRARIVILSGYSQDAAAQDLLNRGALKFFQKPLKYPELISWIANTLAKSNAA